MLVLHQQSWMEVFHRGVVGALTRSSSQPDVGRRTRGFRAAHSSLAPPDVLVSGQRFSLFSAVSHLLDVRSVFAAVGLLIAVSRFLDVGVSHSRSSSCLQQHRPLDVQRRLAVFVMLTSQSLAVSRSQPLAHVGRRSFAFLDPSRPQQFSLSWCSCLT